MLLKVPIQVRGHLTTRVFSLVSTIIPPHGLYLVKHIIGFLSLGVSVKFVAVAT